MNSFLTKQRAVLKVYLLNEIERSKSYGWRYTETIAARNANYHPTHSEIYKALHELTADGLISRHKQRVAERGSGLQEVVLYSFTEDGYHRAQVYKLRVKSDLERSKRLIDSIIADNY